jgi:anti-sigma factor ChrR (cupin superfamily)
MKKYVFDFLEKGCIGEWNAHSQYKGVQIAPLNFENDETWRTLLVQVDSGQSLLPHIHENEIEFHFVIRGNASARRGSETLKYIK